MQQSAVIELNLMAGAIVKNGAYPNDRAGGSFDSWKTTCKCQNKAKSSEQSLIVL